MQWNIFGECSHSNGDLQPGRRMQLRAAVPARPSIPFRRRYSCTVGPEEEDAVQNSRRLISDQLQPWPSKSLWQNYRTISFRDSESSLLNAKALLSSQRLEDSGFSNDQPLAVRQQEEV